jgi:uncharacterized glyoxalase superfamily metalloenzyme YdcJ
MSNNNFIDPSEIRQKFSDALSSMYRKEVPAYGTLLDIVAEVNASIDPTQAVDAARLGQERHGAIRVGTAKELSLLAEAFELLGMEPVSYYDLSVAGLPIHSTAFRPITAKGLAQSPFRMFTSLLRPELIEDIALRNEAETILDARDIFAPNFITKVKNAKAAGGIKNEDADDFVTAFLETFKWHDTAEVSLSTYERLKDHHPLIADIVSFKGPHINHLTPRTLDIDRAQNVMKERGLAAKDVIEGPPHRQCPILLRQTAFKALSEDIKFREKGVWKAGTHTARFGEIEQRGIALTRKGRAHYDKCLNAKDFSSFPDDWETLRTEKLAYFQQTENGYTPLTYEDFLPVSAAGIFRSNLGEEGDVTALNAASNQEAFETALGRPVKDMFDLYEAAASL